MPEAFPDRSAIAGTQLEQLHRLYAAIIPANPFYTQKLGPNTATPSSIGGFIESVPFTTKAEIVADQHRHPPFGTNLTFPLERYTRFHQTSGTSGMPIRWLDTAESWQAIARDWATVFRAAGVSACDRIYFAFSFGPFLGFWLAFDAAQQIGAMCIPGGGLSSAARLRAIADNQATVLCCTPTYCLRLAEVAAEERISLAAGKVRKLIVGGEAGGSVPATRRRLEQLWPGAKVFDHHGMTEVGPVTYECPRIPGTLHIMEEAFIAEIIDSQSGKKARPDETGELVLTTLHRTGSPLIRYRTGDMVKAGADGRCLCGRAEMRLEGGILGRTDDMLVVRGVNIFPSAVEEILRRFPEIGEFQARVSTGNSLSQLALTIECKLDSNQASALVDRLQGQLDAAFNLRIPVTVSPPGTLPRFDMKACRWVRA